MYTEYFGLRAKPFELLPNSNILFPSRAHKRALTYLDYGIQSKAGFILLTGEVGSGKTTLIRTLLRRQDQGMVVSKVFNTRVSSEDLLRLISDDFSLPTEGKDRFALLRGLNDFLIEQFSHSRQALLIIDEAQNLSQQALEEIRLLSNLETDESKLLQIVLVGQPELRDLLSHPNLMQLRQRISVNCHLPPLSLDETSDYILFRLEKAGNRQAVSLSPEALSLVHATSRGIPRLINILCDYVLLDAFSMQTRHIDAELVRTVIRELSFEEIYWNAAGKKPSSTGQPSEDESRRPETTDGKALKGLECSAQRIDGQGKHQQSGCMPARLPGEIEANPGKSGKAKPNESGPEKAASQHPGQHPSLAAMSRPLGRPGAEEKPVVGRFRLLRALSWK